MKASAFSYIKPSTVQETLALLAEHGEEAKLLSGGQSLMPALNLRLSAPAWLIDIGGLDELRGISVADGVLRIGAITRHVELLRSTEVADYAPLLAQAMAHVAHPAIRNKGTLGGNLAHADPASEMPACMVALDAVIVAQNAERQRRIPASEFFNGVYETVLTPDEMLVAIEVRVAKPGQLHFFHEYCRRSGDYAIVGLAASAVVENDRFTDLRLGFFAVGDRPVLANAARELISRPVDAAALAAAQTALDAELDPQEDQQASSVMRRHMARQLLSLCVATLLRRPELEIRRSA
jgi:carbon-monoxide dehydrogenase medium subunit